MPLAKFRRRRLFFEETTDLDGRGLDRGVKADVVS
jgi:hypothetical protein